MGAERPAEILANAQEILSDHRKVTALVLTSEGFGQITRSARRIGDDLYAISDRDGLVHEQILVVNRACPDKFPASTLAKLYRAFSH